MRGEMPVQLGSRAFDILLVLLERPGELVSKEELIAKVWPNTFVAPANVAVHISALRRALGEDRRGKRYVVNISGRGYRFVAPVTVMDDSVSAVVRATSHAPAALFMRAGEDVELGDESFGEAQPQGRLLTIVNSGGLDKATVALAAVKKFVGADENVIWLVDLTPIEPRRGIA
jgi:DNA-binding winged helix-turn-helix (wHTH) protein